jgi:hypothetical protein
MYEIVLTEKQLINTLIEFKKQPVQLLGKKVNPVNVILNECRFIVSAQDRELLVEKLKSIGEDVLLWSGNQLKIIDETQSLVSNPFRLYFNMELNSLYDFNWDSFVDEKEYFVNNKKTINDWPDPGSIGVFCNEILVYDPYFIRNKSNTFYTLKKICDKFSINLNTKLIIVCAPDDKLNFIPDRELSDAKQIIEDLNLDKSKVYILSLQRVFHDRGLITNTVRINPNASFDFLKKGSDAFQNQKATSVNVISNLKSFRYNSTWEIIEELFNACNEKYFGKKIITEGERNSAKGFEETLLYSYWRHIKDNY